ncbi:MAG: hypothetical protein HY049_09635 [Acidobacteria bacterium]|nr:hypothetical protein [Acidobacteriota bacterium]
MKVAFPKNSVVIGVTAALVAVSFAVFANTDPKSPTGGIKTPPALTVGGLAKSLVSEISVNAPAGGFDEVNSLGILHAVGYKPAHPSSSPATVGDLQAMLSVFGVNATSQSPEDSLSPERLGMTLTAMRSTLPRFRIPVADDDSPIARDDNPDKPGPCQIAMMACRNKCQEASPSGTGEDGISGCVQRCQDQFRQCQNRIGSQVGRRH